MDPTNIDNGIAAISLDNEDEDGLVFGDEIGDSSIQQPAYDFCLVGRFLTERPVNFVAMKNTMASLWRPEEGMVVKEVGAGLYIFQFGALAEMERVMEMCPWSFNNQALLLERLGRSQDPSEVSLHHLYVWVRVYGLKRGFFSERVAQRLGNEIGQFVEADPKNFSNPWSSYLRIRVKLDVQKPLKKGTRLKREGKEWFHVDFAYERLPTFCFVCGRLGDRNTKFFHAQASERQRLNRIDRLTDSNGQLRTWSNGLEDTIKEYFEELYHAQGNPGHIIQSLIPSLVSREDNAMLRQPYSYEEVRQAVFSMHPDKSPGGDGFNPAVGSFHDWLLAVLHLFNEYDKGLAFHLLWMIWSARNAKVWKGVRRSPLEVWTRTYRDYEDWWRMPTPRNSTTTNLRAEPGATKGWERPPVNYLKVNVDASSGLVDRYVGLCFIVRDYEGRFVAAKSIKCRGSFGPREAEAIAVKEALSWIKSKGWKQVLVETDCKEVVDSLNSTIMDWSYFNSIIEDCKRLQMLCAGDLNFCFTPRSGNEAAHLLARSSCNDDVVGEWFDTPPNFIPLIS
ncbi:unnamed protein product [Cuscuta campestris]|uniref:RNase H type-1 domain-containing protein n=1 Tax=Cuscuta campestris TaxID=132261 RepID=A0A484NTV6_9ASTE|nr:unnamed protein product [Cuscuta campestris]